MSLRSSLLAATQLSAEFVKQKSGATAVIFALALIPLVLGVGVAVDYSKANAVKASLQKAIDAGTLAAAKKYLEVYDDNSANRDKAIKLIQEEGQRIFLANAPEGIRQNYKQNDAKFDIIHLDSKAAGTFTGKVPTYFMGVAGIDQMSVYVMSQAQVKLNKGEVVLALDVTGSMKYDMDLLKELAIEAYTTIKTMSKGNVKVGLVPYAATVNANAQAFSEQMQNSLQLTSPSTETLEDFLQSKNMWDREGKSRYHGQAFENLRYRTKNCTVLPAPPGNGNGNPPPPGNGNPPPPPPADERSIDQKILGSSTPSDDQLIVGQTWTYGTGLRNPGQLDPVPLDNHEGCWTRTDFQVNHFDLFSALYVPYGHKGCAEARPYPLDVQDDEPDPTKPDTLFVPWFWPDEVGIESEQKWTNASGFSRNSYLNDLRNAKASNESPPSWLADESIDDPILNRGYVWKYQNKNIYFNLSPIGGNGFGNFLQPGWGFTYYPDRRGQYLRGPNAGCPDPIVTLNEITGLVWTPNGFETGHFKDLRPYIYNLKPIEGGGGTNIKEGLAWAWRVISPGNPYTAGPYGDKYNPKTIILFTDGINELDSQANEFNISDYSAEGYAYYRRDSQGYYTPHRVSSAADRNTVRANFTRSLNERTAQLCSNIKAKGVEIIVVMFDRAERPAGDQSVQTLQNCASNPQFSFFKASSRKELTEAFRSIVLKNSSLTLIK